MDSLLKKLDLFYEENKSKINMPSNENHPLDYKKAIDWVNSQCDEESYKFADQIIRATKYVSFIEFRTKLLQLCNTYVENTKNENAVFVVLFPFDISKSNLWVFLLAYPVLREKIGGIMYSMTEVYNNMVNPSSYLYGKNVRCILCDDCAYTGTQIIEVASLNPYYLQYKNKPIEPSTQSIEWLKWYDDIKKNVANIQNSISINNLSVDLIVPYICHVALKKIQKIKHIRVIKNTTYLPSFIQQLNVKFQPHILNQFKYTFQYHGDISAVYFDHKVADSLSTFNKVYLLAPAFNCKNMNTTIRFINNCDNIFIPSDINIYEHYNNVEPFLMDNTCPKSFYKSIIYTYKDQILEKEKFLQDILDS